MSDKPFRRVNWTTGMLLTPEHFRRSDAFSVELFEWLLRNTTATSGLVGGGPRLSRGERGLAATDPHFQLHDDGTTLQLSVLQARGVTPDGGYVEIARPRVVSRAYRKDELPGADEFVVFVVRTESDEADAESVGEDPANPLPEAFVQEGYRVELGVRAEESPRALAIGRIRRAVAAQTFERDAQFIPPCATMMAHSSLYDGWERMQSDLRLLADGFAELHRVIAEFVDRASRIGKPFQDDHSISGLVERAALAADACAFDTLDASSSPAQVFQQVERLGRTIALALQLSETTRDFLTLLGDVDAAYTGLLRDERQTLSAAREVVPGKDLRLDLVHASQGLDRIKSLLRAIEARYLDYRVNPTIDTLRFLIDVGGEHFYALAARSSNIQRTSSLLTIVFTDLKLSGRQSYRLLLLADPNGVPSCQPGESLRPTVRINSAAGGGRPITRTLDCQIDGQRNFALDLDDIEVETISTMHVTLEEPHKVRGAVLYQRTRQLGFGGPSGANVRSAATTSQSRAGGSGKGEGSVGPRSGERAQTPSSKVVIKGLKTDSDKSR
ncbi:MAG: hypothetical protein IPK33_03140 [Gemmatimonadetes bacterium]|nr:hypothetical protein [Gemmatimonadota bacterium]